MAKGFKRGAGGGNPLNFKVVGNPQPANPKENTIWIDTDRINNTYFSATQPENMDDYDVWITTGISSSAAFTATEKDPIMVYPINAKQYVGGALVDKPAKSHQGGEWVEWMPSGSLFWNGNQCVNLTGGWEQNPNLKVYGIANTGIVTIGNTIILQAPSQAAIASTKLAIPLSGYSELYIEIKSTATNALIVTLENISTTDAGSGAILKAFAYVGENILDISGISSQMLRLVLSVYNGNAAEISRIKLR